MKYIIEEYSLARLTAFRLKYHIVHSESFHMSGKQAIARQICPNGRLWITSLILLQIFYRFPILVKMQVGSRVMSLAMVITMCAVRSFLQTSPVTDIDVGKGDILYSATRHTGDGRTEITYMIGLDITDADIAHLSHLWRWSLRDMLACSVSQTHIDRTFCAIYQNVVH